MSRIVYVNGKYKPYAEARIHVEDRGFQFADSVYEVCQVRAGRLVDEGLHMQRLMRSMTGIGLTGPAKLSSLGVIMRETVRRNKVYDGMIYLQVSRGAARRDFGFPPAETPGTVVCFARPIAKAVVDAKTKQGIRVITIPENCWRRVDIKTTGLLPNILARQAAKMAGADDAWFVDDHGFITEGTASNAWIITADGRICTRSADQGILRGVTREVLSAAIRQTDYSFIEQAFTPADVINAREAFSTAATHLITPVVAIDGVSIANGAPGMLTCELRELLHNHIKISEKYELLT